MFDMDTPISIDVHPSSPPSRLQSPEPSGTPDLARISAHRETALFGYSHGILHMEDEKASPSSTNQRFEFVETSICQPDHKRLPSQSSLPELENGRLDMVIDCEDDLGFTRTSLEQDSVEEKWHLPCEVNLSSPNRKGHNQNLKATSKPISQDSRAARLQDKLFNLVEKVNTLQWNHPVQTSSSISIPVKSGRNIADLQKKIESLKLQVLKERNQRQAVAQQLNTLRHQNEKDLQHKQKIWENKFRELQKEKYNLSIRLQTFEMSSPRQRIALGEDAHLTDEDVKHLRKEIEQQESLIRGYQIENERATESLREAQRQAKERERLLLEQNNALVTQLASLQASYSPKRSNEMAYASLTESLSLKAEILNAQARESALITELEKIKDDKKILENKVSDLEGKVNMRTKQPNETRDVPCQCLHSNDETACFHPENPDPEDKTGSTTSQQNMQIQVDAKEKKAQNLQRRMENMRREYDVKIAELKQQLEKKLMTSQEMEKSNIRKIKELEARISDIRSFYTKKLKEHEEKTETKKAKKSDRKLVAATSTFDRKHNASGMQDLEIYKKKVESLEKSLRDKEAIIKHLEQNHSGIDREEALSCINKVEAVRHGSLMDEEQPKCTEHSSKEVYLSAKEGALDTSKSSQVERGIGEKSIQFPTKDSGDVSHTLDATKPSSRENYVDLVPHLYQDASNIPLAKSAESQHIFNGRQEENNYIETFNERTELPQSDQLRILQEKIIEMESRQKHRELEWQALLIDTKRLLDEERDKAGRKWQMAMEARNSEINRFKLELDAILETAIQMQRAQLSKA